LSCTLPEELQIQLVRQVKGLEKAEINVWRIGMSGVLSVKENVKKI
jgi:tRNA U34 5-carboxymethylaminomethyl modifying enzyme MnmG/GidA